MEDDFNKQFDEWVKLFKEDPKKFEEMRKDILEQQLLKMAARNTPEEIERLRSMLWKTEKELEKFKDPIARYNKMVELFFAHLLKEGKESQKENNNVIKFKKR